jgi:hypothetical protein
LNSKKFTFHCQAGTNRKTKERSEQMTNIDIYRKRITALILMSVSPILAVGPFVIGIVGANLTPGCNESNCPWGVLPWFTFLTAPAALILFIVALIRFLTSLGTRHSKSSDATPQERKLKLWQLWMATATGPLLLAIVLLLAVFGGPVSVCDLNEVCTETPTGTFVGILLRVAPVLLALTWLYLGGVWIWNRVKK